MVSVEPPAAISTFRRRTRACSNRSTGLLRTLPDKSLADPTATVLSVAMLLAHLGLPAAAAQVEQAVAADLAGSVAVPFGVLEQIGDALAAAASSN